MTVAGAASTRHTLEFVSRNLVQRTARILEIGCGDGALAAALMDAGHAVVAIDSDGEAAARARALGVKATVAEWPHFDGGQFDAVLFSRSLHHVERLDESVSAAFGVLRPGGRLIVEDFRAEGGSKRNQSWFSGLARLLDSAGLVKHPTPYLRQTLSAVGELRDHETHELHSSLRLCEALAARDPAVRVETTAYYFRYFEPVRGVSALASLIRDHELELIDAGAIDPLGYRLVGECPA